jgi:hypothetical protein
MIIILCQWDFNKEAEKLVTLLLYTSENCSRKSHDWVHLVPSQETKGQERKQQLHLNPACGKYASTAVPTFITQLSYLLSEAADIIQQVQLWCLYF